MTDCTPEAAALPESLPRRYVAEQPFIVMVKPVGSSCNLACSYCYYSKAESPGQHMRQPRMTDDVLERFIRSYIEASAGPVVSFTWHGGEPVLAGLDFYRLAVDLQRRFLPEGWRCWNNLQTNGTLLDDEWCSFLAEARFDVGLSIDGAQWIHDQYRKDHTGRGSYRSAMEAVQRLQAHGIQPDLLCTVTSASADEPLAVYRALRNLGTGWIQFIPIVRREAGGSQTPDSVSAAKYGDFLCSVFDEWALHDLGRLDVQLFAETVRVWSGGEAGLCWMAPTCGRALIVESDGGVYSCDHFVAPGYRLGNVSGTPLGELADSPAQIRFGEDKRDRLPAQCLRCPWLTVCNGGCPKDRFAISEDGEPGFNHLCEGLRRFFAYAQPAVNLMALLSGKGFSATAVMAELRAYMQSRWKGVGRNDPCPCGSGRKAKNCCWTKRP